ncbi:MAG: winged helix-turn-helix domain-containing protein [Gluconacetobacter diazotrophicus]|nr:winged helix-turn-helix domain-containing protein [Gluconacetobacter diazotrophicus]
MDGTTAGTDPDAVAASPAAPFGDLEREIRGLVLAHLAAMRLDLRGAGPRDELERLLAERRPARITLEFGPSCRDGFRSDGPGSDGSDRSRSSSVVRIRSRSDTESVPEPVVRFRTARFGSWSLDLVRRRLWRHDGGVTGIPAAEFRVLRRFLDRPQVVLTREMLLPERGGTVAFDRSVDQLILRLRRRLACRMPGGEPFITVRNEGYMFSETVAFE